MSDGKSATADDQPEPDWVGARFIVGSRVRVDHVPHVGTVRILDRALNRISIHWASPGGSWGEWYRAEDVKPASPVSASARRAYPRSQSAQVEEILYQRLRETVLGFGMLPTSVEDLDLWETRRMRYASRRAGHYPADMTKRERQARRLIDSAITPGALVHYMGVYAGAIPE